MSFGTLYEGNRCNRRLAAITARLRTAARHSSGCALRPLPMFSFPIMAALAVVVTATSFISGIFGMAGGMLLIGFLLFVVPVQTAMVMHGVTQIAANGWRAFLWPQRIAPNIEGPGQAYMAGVIGGAIQLVSGVTGPLLDIFYVRTGMTRQVNVATKAAAQVLGHLSKVAYFAAVIEGPAGRDLEQWLVMAYAACFAVLGTTLSRSLLDRMSDKQFYRWTRRVILGVGAVYAGQGFWLMVTR